jgi:hypothetical protein
MKFHGYFIAGFAAIPLVSAPSLAQTSPDTQQQPAGKTASENPADASTGAQKQHTQGSAAIQAPQYGGAQKQHTQGSAGVEPQQYGSDWARARKQPDN